MWSRYLVGSDRKNCGRDFGPTTDTRLFYRTQLISASPHFLHLRTEIDKVSEIRCVWYTRRYNKPRNIVIVCVT